MLKKRSYRKPIFTTYGNVRQLTEKKGPQKIDGHQGERSELS